ncbi:hypothetical protein MHTCC0001_21810 [Flavobacteriaceae bacterium MHTCC 0001]
MANNTKPTKEKSNYWGYIIFSALILLYIPFADDIWNASNTTARTNYRPDKQTQTQNRQNTSTNNNTSKTGNYCSLSSLETYNYLLDTRSFTLNGNGSVRFTKRFDHGRDKWVEDKFIISSGTYRLEGLWQVKRGNLITIKNFRVISGSFDASNNSTSRGMLTIGCNGNLEGILRDRNGNTIDILIKK